MQDPFHTYHISPGCSHALVHEASEAEPELPGSTRLASHLRDTMISLTTYRAMRLAGCHIALTTDSIRHAPMPHSDLALAIASPWNADWRDKADPNTGASTIPNLSDTDLAAQVKADMNIRAFLAAMVSIGELSPPDIKNPWDPSVSMDQLLATPASAELLTQLCSAWSALNPPAWLPRDTPGLTDPGLSATSHLTDPGSLSSSMLDHHMLMPALVPVDRLSWEPPNRPSHSSRRTWHDHPGIPLAWGWDPRMRPALQDDDLKYPEFDDNDLPPLRKQAQETGYGPCWAAGTGFDLIASARSARVTGEPDPSLDPLRWEYAILSIPVRQSTSMFTPDPADWSRWTGNMRTAVTWTGAPPFNLSAGIRQSMIRHRVLDGPHQHRMSWEKIGDLFQPWWGADAPIAGLLSGMNQKNAMRMSTTLALGFNPYRERDLGSPRAPEAANGHLWSHLNHEWGMLPDYGPLAALQGGLRYVISSMLSGHFSGKGRTAEGLMHFPQSESAPTPTPGFMHSHNHIGSDRGLRGKKAWLRRKRGSVPTVRVQTRTKEDGPLVTVDTRRVDINRMPRRGQAAPSSVSNFDMWWRDSVSHFDLSLARGIVAPGAMFCLASMIEKAESGGYGPLVRQWIRLACTMAEALRYHQYQEGQGLPGAPGPHTAGADTPITPDYMAMALRTRAGTRLRSSRVALSTARRMEMF